MLFQRRFIELAAFVVVELVVVAMDVQAVVLLQEPEPKYSGMRAP
jgi:hypothetical protein